MGKWRFWVYFGAAVAPAGLAGIEVAAANPIATTYVVGTVLSAADPNPLRVSFGKGGTKTKAEGVVPQKPYGMPKPIWK